MSQDNYNPDSIDAVLSRIENTLNNHVIETRVYRQSNDAKHDLIQQRLSELDGDKKKIVGIAIGSGLGAGGIGTFLAKFLGSGGGH